MKKRKKTKHPQSASRLKSYLIIINSLLLFLKYCLIAIFVSFSKDKKNKRIKLDNYLRRWAIIILSYPKANITVTNPDKIKYEKDKPYILMSNHASLYDIPIIYHYDMVVVINK